MEINPRTTFTTIPTEAEESIKKFLHSQPADYIYHDFLLYRPTQLNMPIIVEFLKNWKLKTQTSTLHGVEISITEGYVAHLLHLPTNCPKLSSIPEPTQEELNTLVAPGAYNVNSGYKVSHIYDRWLKVIATWWTTRFARKVRNTYVTKECLKIALCILKNEPCSMGSVIFNKLVADIKQLQANPLLPFNLGHLISAMADYETQVPYIAVLGPLSVETTDSQHSASGSHHSAASLPAVQRPRSPTPPLQIIETSVFGLSEPPLKRFRPADSLPINVATPLLNKALDHFANGLDILKFIKDELDNAVHTERLSWKAEKGELETEVKNLKEKVEEQECTIALLKKKAEDEAKVVAQEKEEGRKQLEDLKAEVDKRQKAYEEKEESFKKQLEDLKSSLAQQKTDGDTGTTDDKKEAYDLALVEADAVKDTLQKCFDLGCTVYRWCTPPLDLELYYLANRTLVQLKALSLGIVLELGKPMLEEEISCLMTDIILEEDHYLLSCMSEMYRRTDLQLAPEMCPDTFFGCTLGYSASFWMQAPQYIMDGDELTLIRNQVDVAHTRDCVADGNVLAARKQWVAGIDRTITSLQLASKSLYADHAKAIQEKNKLLVSSTKAWIGIGGDKNSPFFYPWCRRIFVTATKASETVPYPTPPDFYPWDSFHPYQPSFLHNAPAQELSLIHHLVPDWVKDVASSSKP